MQLATSLTFAPRCSRARIKRCIAPAGPLHRPLARLPALPAPSRGRFVVRRSTTPDQPPAGEEDPAGGGSSSGDAGDASSSSSSSDGSSGSPSTSYLLPFDTEPPPLPPNYASIQANIGHMDNNQLQTALGVAIAAEDYVLAARIKDRLQAKLLESGSAVVSKPMDWRALGVPDWLADRAERLGLMFPTEVQRRSTPVILSGADCVIASETGSGKTAAFVVPALSRLDYPPDLFPEDLEGPQLLLLVPSFELGVQACMLLYKLWGGNISTRTPGDPGNMFTYTGPPGIKVRGVLNDEEVQMAAGGRYLRGVHALVATPDMALALLSLPDSPLSFQDLRFVAVDEMDALLDAYPASFGQLLDAAVNRYVPPGFQQAAGAQGLTAVGLDMQEEGPQQPGDAGSSSGAGDAGAPGDAAGEAGSGSSSGGAEQQQHKEGDAAAAGQDNIARLKALLSEKQQQQQGKARKTQQQGPGADSGVTGLGAGAGGSAGGSASLAAAAARLEGLLAAPAANPAGEAADSQQQQQQQDQQQQQQQQQGQEAGASGQPPEGAAAAASSGSAAAASSDDDPMPKVQVVLVGATISDDDMALALSRGWVSEPVVVRVGAEGCVPAGLKHRAVVVSQGQQRLGGLVASLRKDLGGELAAADTAAAAAAAGGGTDGGTDGGGKQQPVRVVVFARSEDEARAAAEPLRAALWGDHMLSVLLPSTGAEPVKALTAFRDRVASLLLATPSAARGLDLPAVSHVYSIGLPQDATEYVHRAGRAGRIGSTSGGEVVSVVTREELPLLLAMVGDELGLHLDVLDLERQASGMGLLGSSWEAAREGLLLRDGDEAEEGEDGERDGGGSGGDDDGRQEQPGQQGGSGGGSGKEEQLEAARKGLEDLFNLL